MTTNPVMTELAAVRSELAKLKAQRVTYVEAPVSAVDSSGSTFTVTVTGQDTGTQALSGVAAPSQFLPDVGQTVRLAVSGAQPIYQPVGIAANAVTYRELNSTISTDITGAVNTSTQALTAANGKNEVTYSPNVAAASTPGGTAGDTWFQRNASGVIIGQWEWSGSAWQPRTLSDLVISSITAGKIVTGTLSATLTVTGAIQSSATGKRWTADANGVRLYDGVSTTPVIDLNSSTGSATFRGTVEGALIRTASSGQRLEIQSGSTAGGRTLSFYPSSSTGGPATVYSRDDDAGNAGVSLQSGGPSYGFLNFTSTRTDIGMVRSGTLAATFFRTQLDDSTYAATIGVESGKRLAITTSGGVDFFSGQTTWGQLRPDNSMSRITKFALGGGPNTAFVFGTNPGDNDADVYAQRFVSTNAGGTGGFVYFSDQRLKNNVRTANLSALKDLLAIPIRQFEWASTGQTDTGFIAQELPAAFQVRLAPDQPMDGVADPIGVSNERIVVWIVKALQQIATAINYKP